MTVLSSVYGICGMGVGTFRIQGTTQDHLINVTSDICSESSFTFGETEKEPVTHQATYNDNNEIHQLMSWEDVNSILDLDISGLGDPQFTGSLFVEIKIKRSGNPSYITFVDYANQYLTNFSVPLDFYSSLDHLNTDDNTKLLIRNYPNEKNFTCSRLTSGGRNACGTNGLPSLGIEVSHLFPVIIAFLPVGEGYWFNPDYSILHANGWKFGYRHNDNAPVILQYKATCGEFST